ncbi:ABC transporter permease [Acidaminobacter sp. JC074]|uniref:ABC transporter permease n=1 Tax=Acidaminobacter sp. JC074 TaxID=2530199 RepID=UPI001F0FA39B|nr:ABC transporter permease [Acidaminobacter sp. JC074]MCH4889142.1 ABC transporter permease [Acidaminobacter sp. JC074]
MLEFLYQIFPYALAFTAPILITAIGGLISERSGVVNIGLEGLMIIGTFVGAYVIHLYTQNLDPGQGVSFGMVSSALLAAALAGGIFALLHAYASISLNANQIISGTAINMLAAAFALFMSELLTGSERLGVLSGVERFDFPVLSKIPLIGPLFFTKMYMTTYLVLFIVLIVWFVLYKTPFGLRLRSCGEFPQASASMGINVIRMRYIGVFFSGVFAGLGGAILVLTYKGEFTGAVDGLGFLALATLIFGQWKPWRVVGASFFFGFMRTMSTMASVNDSLKALALPQELYKALPYVLTLVALLLFSKNAVGPKAAGESYDAGKR